MRDSFIAALWWLAGCGAMGVMAADGPREVHGSADAFAAPGVALAWGVLRGATEADTRIVIRIATDRNVTKDRTRIEPTCGRQR